MLESEVEGLKKFEVDNTMSGYASPLTQVLTRFLEKHRLYAITRKLPAIFFRGVSFLMSSILIRLRIFSYYVLDNINWIFNGSIWRKRLKKYSPDVREKIKRYVMYRNAKHITRAFLEDILKVPSCSLYPGSYKKYVKIENLDYLIDVLKKKRNSGGAILIAAHHGNHILMASAISLAVQDHLGFKGSTFAQEGTITAVERFMGACINLIDLPKNSKDVKAKEGIDNVFKRGEFLFLYHDAGFSRQPLVDIFGEFCHTPLGISSLFRKFKPAIIPVYMIPDKKKIRHTLYIKKDVSDKFLTEEFLEKNPNLTKKDLIFRNALIGNQIIEKIIRENPWYWLTLWNAQEIKRYYKKFTFRTNKIKNAILQQIEYFSWLIDNSYELGRDDSAIKNILSELKSDLEQL